MENLKMRIKEFATEKGAEFKENTSYFKVLKDKHYIFGGRKFKKYVRIWIKTSLDRELDSFPEGNKPIYEELHKNFKWVSYNIVTLDELEKILSFYEANTDLFMYDINNLDKIDAEEDKETKKKTKKEKEEDKETEEKETEEDKETEEKETEEK